MQRAGGYWKPDLQFLLCGPKQKIPRYNSRPSKGLEDDEREKLAAPALGFRSGVFLPDTKKSCDAPGGA